MLQRVQQGLLGELGSCLCPPRRAARIKAHAMRFMFRLLIQRVANVARSVVIMGQQAFQKWASSAMRWALPSRP